MTFEDLEEKWVETEEGCWEWEGYVNGGTPTARVDGRRIAAHRVTYNRYHGEEFSGQFAWRCENDLCVNPEHVAPQSALRDERILEVLMEKSEPKESGCRVWTAAVHPEKPYGHVKYQGDVRLAHNVAWEAYSGEPVPGRLYVQQSCGERLCIAEEHLYLSEYEEGKEPEERFLEKTTRDSETGCRLWEGAASQGYGQFRLEGETCQAHRAAWRLFVGDLPEGYRVFQVCEEPLCVEPEHLGLARYYTGEGVRKRFWSKVDKGEEDDCWEWLASTHQGYGVFSFTKKAHLVAWELEKGEAPPPDKVLDHTCENPACVNVEHLEPVSHAENIRRGYDSERRE